MQKVLLILLVITVLTSAASIRKPPATKKYRSLPQMDPIKGTAGGIRTRSPSVPKIMNSLRSLNERYGNYNTPYYNYYNGNPYEDDVYSDYYNYHNGSPYIEEVYTDFYDFGRIPPYYYEENVYGYNPLVYGYGGIVY